MHCYNTLEEYYYEVQLHKALYDFTVETGYCWFKESLPPPTNKGIICCCFETIEDLWALSKEMQILYRTIGLYCFSEEFGSGFVFCLRDVLTRGLYWAS